MAAVPSEVEPPGFAGGYAEASPSCRIDYYFTPGCEQCRDIENNILSQIREMFGARTEMRRHNLYDPAEYAAARDILGRLAVQAEDNVFIVVDREFYLGGAKNIGRDLIPTVEERLMSGSPRDHAPANAGHGMAGTARTPAGGYAFPYSFAALLAAGLLDGVNPCAFATIVFLITSLLAGGQGRRENLLLIGLGFCSAVYLTYFLIGLGLFQIFLLSSARVWLSNLLNGVLIFALVIMAFISFRDAWIFRRTGRPDDVVLKLPERISKRVHDVIRSNRPRKYYFAGSFFLGCVVTMLESVCTGQLYVPTLAFLARAAPLRARALAGLALYNLMFILPLAAVFFLACCGMGQRTLMDWSRKNFLWAKCALGVFFVLLAVLLVLS